MQKSHRSHEGPLPEATRSSHLAATAVQGKLETPRCLSLSLKGSERPREQRRPWSLPRRCWHGSCCSAGEDEDEVAGRGGAGGSDSSVPKVGPWPEALTDRVDPHGFAGSCGRFAPTDPERAGGSRENQGKQMVPNACFVARLLPPGRAGRAKERSADREHNEACMAALAQEDASRGTLGGAAPPGGRAERSTKRRKGETARERLRKKLAVR